MRQLSGIVNDDDLITKEYLSSNTLTMTVQAFEVSSNGARTSLDLGLYPLTIKMYQQDDPATYLIWHGGELIHTTGFGTLSGTTGTSMTFIGLADSYIVEAFGYLEEQ